MASAFTIDPLSGQPLNTKATKLWTSSPTEGILPGAGTAGTTDPFANLSTSFGAPAGGATPAPAPAPAPAPTPAQTPASPFTPVTPAPNAPPMGAPPPGLPSGTIPAGGGATAAPDWTNPAVQQDQISQWIAQSPDKWNGTTAQYFINRINQTGGFTPDNIAYWQKMILGGSAAHAAADAGGSAASGLQPLDPALEAAIQQLLAEGNTPVTANDAIIQPQVQAYQTAQDRAVAQTRAANAEAAAYQGAPTSSFDTENQANLEKEGQNIGTFQAGLMANELTARRDQVVQALQFAQGEDAQSLQLELAQLNDALSRAQMAQQNQQFYDTMGTNIGEFNANLNAQLQQQLGQGA